MGEMNFSYLSVGLIFDWKHQYRHVSLFLTYSHLGGNKCQSEEKAPKSGLAALSSCLPDSPKHRSTGGETHVPRLSWRRKLRSGTSFENTRPPPTTNRLIIYSSHVKCSRWGAAVEGKDVFLTVVIERITLQLLGFHSSLIFLQELIYLVKIRSWKTCNLPTVRATIVHNHLILTEVCRSPLFCIINPGGDDQASSILK